MKLGAKSLVQSQRQRTSSNGGVPHFGSRFGASGPHSAGQPSSIAVLSANGFLQWSHFWPRLLDWKGNEGSSLGSAGLGFKFGKQRGAAAAATEIVSFQKGSLGLPGAKRIRASFTSRAAVLGSFCGLLLLLGVLLLSLALGLKQKPAGPCDGHAARHFLQESELLSLALPPPPLPPPAAAAAAAAGQEATVLKSLSYVLLSDEEAAAAVEGWSSMDWIVKKGKSALLEQFSGAQTMQQRRESFKISEHKTVHCGFGAKGSGFDISQADRSFMEACTVVVATAIFGGLRDLLRQPEGVFENTKNKVDPD